MDPPGEGHAPPQQRSEALTAGCGGPRGATLFQVALEGPMHPVELVALGEPTTPANTVALAVLLYERLQGDQIAPEIQPALAVACLHMSQDLSPALLYGLMAKLHPEQTLAHDLMVERFKGHSHG